MVNFLGLEIRLMKRQKPSIPDDKPKLNEDLSNEDFRTEYYDNPIWKIIKDNFGFKTYNEMVFVCDMIRCFTVLNRQQWANISTARKPNYIV